MATSGVTTVTLTANDLLDSAYELARVKDPNEDMSDVQAAKGIKAANKIIKYFQKMGMPLWAVKKDTIGLVKGQQDYTCGTSGTGLNERPLRIIEAFYRDGNNDTPVDIVSREEYWALGDKTEEGTPNQIYYDPQLTRGVLYIYNTADTNAAGNNLHLVYHRPFEVISSLANELDFPEEWQLALEYTIATDLALRNGIKQSRVAQLKGLAAEYFYETSWWDVENTSTQIIPDED